MRTRKSRHLLSLLRPKEFATFRKRLSSSTQKLFDAMLQDDRIAQVWSRVIPNRPLPERPFLDNYFRKLESQLSKELEQYYVMTLIQGNSALYGELTDRAVSERISGESLATPHLIQHRRHAQGAGEDTG